MRKHKFLVVPGIAGLAVALAVVGVWLSGYSNVTAQAQQPITIAYDMVTAGNTCPGTGTADCAVGPIDSCIHLPSGGGDIEFDVVAKNLPVFQSPPYENVDTLQFTV